MSIPEIANQIKQRGISHKPVMIAIEGFGGSGKSTIAALLKHELGNSYVVNIDDFIIKEKISDPIKSNFDRLRLEKQILLPLKNGQEAAYQRLDWASNTLSDYVSIPQVDYLIVEGVSSYDPAIEDYYDFKIWVEAPPVIAQKRGSDRDKNIGNDNDGLWDNWTETYRQYKEIYHPERKADFIIDNTENKPQF